MDFRTQITIESKAVEGASFVVRFLNRRQALELESTIIETRERIATLKETMINASGDDVSIVDGEEVRKWRITPGHESEFRRSSMEHDRLMLGVVYPAYIKAGLVSLDGFTIDGKAPSSDELVASGMDAFVHEIGEACFAQATLSEDDQKNLLSPTILPEADGTALQPSIVPAA